MCEQTETYQRTQAANKISLDINIKIPMNLL